MTITKGIALFVPVVLAGALVYAAGPPPGAGAPVARLKAISTRVTGQGASIVIEATGPTAYVATRPEPLTVYVDFRNVGADGVANRFARDVKSPIAAVAVETSDALGAPVARVRITLARAVAYRVHADRNNIVVDFDKPSGDSGDSSDSADSTYVLPPVSRERPDAMAALAPADVQRLSGPGRSSGVPGPGRSSGVPGAGRSSGVPGPGRSSGVPGPGRSSGVPGPGGASGVDPIAVLGLSTSARAAGVPAAALAVALSPTAPPTAPSPAAAPGQAAAPQPAPAPGVPPAQGAQIGSLQQTERRFTGSLVSLDFQGADLRAVLRTFAEVSGLNMVIDPTVQGSVDVALRDVPWDQALDIILRANKLGYIVDGTIVRIAPLTVLAEEESQVRKLADEKALAGELRVLTKSLSYAKGEELQALLTKSALSPRGTVQVDARTNTLIITDLSDRLQTASDLIATLDRAQPQVEIEARIVQTSKNFARALGIQWGFNGRVDPQLGNTTNLAFPNNGSLSGQASGPLTSTPAGTAVNLPVPGAPSAVRLALGSINGAFNLDLALSAAESSGQVRLLSTPRVSTQNNIEAEIAQGEQIPYQTVSNNTTTTTFRDAALTLKVLPQITAAGTVIMRIAVDNGSRGPDAGNPPQPSIRTQRANTTVLVRDGETTVIGGIYSSSENSNTDRTPGLSRIPLLKWLFKRDTLSDSNSELLIFITPRIIKG